ncbi:phosphotransferase family protein [Paenibacillus sp. S-38]|uniref:phosphotransferase family protein n=1 Tax=Paenibacillus sp. S-38 TaxID=3416710 RepID=UPI003CED21A0
MGLPIGDVVLSGGILDDSRILRRETLYTGMNGKRVERFYVSPAESYVFKPLTHNGQSGRESWVYDQVLQSLPPIYPRLLARSGDGAEEDGWLIFEDMGPMEHTFGEEIVLRVAEEMAVWHASPADRWIEAPLKGQKPSMEEITGELLRSRDAMAELLLPRPAAAEHLQGLLHRLESWAWSRKRVLSHGDLHLGNYALMNGRLIVLDWEHAHLNTPFWDLYHLVDLSHPLFPKQVTEGIREKALERYLDCTGAPPLERTAFKREYYLFSAAFSLWMLGLIAGDLQRGSGPWTRTELERQREETQENFIQCVRHTA